MADPNLLGKLIVDLTQKENTPPPDDNTQIIKSFVPNDSMQLDDGNAVTIKVLNPANFKWGGNDANGNYISPGWMWGAGKYK